MATRIDGGTLPNLLKTTEARTESNIPQTAAQDAKGNPAGWLDQGRDMASKAVKLNSAVKDGFAQASKVKQSGLGTAYAQAKKDLIANAQSSNVKLTAGTVLKKGLTGISVLTNLAQLPGKVLTTARDVRTALRTGNGQAWNKVIGDVGTTGKSAALALRGSLELGRDIAKYSSAYKAAGAAFRAAVPGATKAVVSAASRKAALLGLEGAAKGTAKAAVTTAALDAAKNSGTIARAVVGTADRAAAKAALRAGGKAAAEAGLEAGARSAAGPLARAAGRFAPGVNIAIAAFDTASAVSALRDPTASKGRKITSCITAVGSIAAATNIPIVSQVGAGISVASSIIGGLFFSK